MDYGEQANPTVTAIRQNLDYNVPDDELVRAVDRAINDSKELKEKMDKVGKTNKLYWAVGTAKDMSQWHPKRSRITSNRIFTDVETAIPILTSETPEPTVIGATDNNIQDRIQKGLQIAYEVKYRMQQILQKVIRQWFWNRIGILKYRWDKQEEFITELVLARKMGFDKRATSRDNCEYIWELLEDTAENLIEKFPKKKDIIEQIVSKDSRKSKLQYHEFWGGNGQWVCWKINQTILDKMKNPNYDYENEENNVFEKPTFPYLLLNVFHAGDEEGMYDSTSLIEESASLQEGVNQLEQQILDMNEGQKRVWVISAEASSAKQVQQLVDSTGDLCLYLDRKAPPGGVQQVQSGKPDASLFNNLTSNLAEIDNVMGVHSITRGQTAEKQVTLGQEQIQQGSDYGRLDLIVRNIEQLIEEWYNAYLHCVKVYSIMGINLSNGKDQTIEIKREEIPKGIIVMVKKGSTLPIDRKTKMNNAIMMAKFGMIDPATLFEEMGFPNVEKRTQALFQWLQATGKVAPPQPQMPLQGQPGATQGQPQGRQTGQQGSEQIKSQQLQRVQKALTSPQFQQMPPQEQQQIVEKAKVAVTQIKGG